METTGLAVLMTRFGIKGISLAKFCHVTPAMISFWKTGHRSLYEDNPFCEQIADYACDFYNRNKTDFLPRLQRTFNKYNIKVDVKKASDRELTRAFMRLISIDKAILKAV